MSEKTELLTKVAELYYLQKLNQSEIAAIIGTSRPTISRLLDEAREEGIVTIFVKTATKKNHELSRRLRETFQLKEAVVVTSANDYLRDAKHVAAAAQEFLLSILKQDTRIGISWGGITKMLIDGFPQCKFPDSHVVQMAGSVGGYNSGIDGTELAYNFSKKLGGTYSGLYAPVYVDSPALSKELMSQTLIQNILDEYDSLDVTAMGIGSLGTGYSTLRNSNYMPDETIGLLESQGAVGHILARMYDIHGREVDRTDLFPISRPLKDLEAIPIKIGFAASAERTDAALGALNGGHINVLICDESLASEVLAQSQ